MTSQPQIVQPPRIAVRLVNLFSSDEEAETIEGDLLEEYTHIASKRGSSFARRWYWRQTLGAVRVHAVGLLSSAMETEVSATQCIEDLVMWIILGVFAFIQLPVCADLFLSWTPLTRSELSIIVAGTTIGAALLAAATTVHIVRMRAAR